MTAKMYFSIVIGVGLLISGLTWGGFQLVGHFTHQDPAFVCNPTPDEQCPSPAFLVDFNHLKSLNEEIAKESQSPAILSHQAKIDESNGLYHRLEQEIPPGWKYDPGKQRLVKAHVPESQKAH